MSKEKPNYALAKIKAQEIIERFEYEEPPINPAEICSRYGIEVCFIDFPSKYANISGLFSQKEDKIYVNNNESIKRQIFTIAHELGHKILHEEYIRSSGYQVLAWNSDYQEKNNHEKEADYFAQNLLVPRFMLKKYIDMASVKDLLEIFIVSEQTIGYRLIDEYE